MDCLKGGTAATTTACLVFGLKVGALLLVLSCLQLGYTKGRDQEMEDCPRLWVAQKRGEVCLFTGKPEDCSQSKFSGFNTQ